MTTDVDDELAALERMSTNELCERYQQLYGQPVRTRHKQHLVRKIAWRIQALAEGDLSERARRRAAELAHDADVRVTPPRENSAAAMRISAPRKLSVTTEWDPRLPAPGTVIVRENKGARLE